MEFDLTRVHEAGHWLMAQRFGLPVTAVQVSVETATGYTEVDITGADSAQLALLAAAGAGAEIAVFGEIRSNTQLVTDLEAYTWRNLQHFRRAARAASRMLDVHALGRLYVLL